MTKDSLMLDKSRLTCTDMNGNQPDVPGNAFTYCVEDRDMYCGMENRQAEELLRDNAVDGVYMMDSHVNLQSVR